MRKTRVRRAIVAALLGAGIALAPLGTPADAGHLCGARTIDIPGPSGTLFYIQDRVEPGSTIPNGLIGGGEGTWIFMESNGKPKLQVGGDWIGGVDIGSNDPCPASGTPDTVIF